MTNPGDASQRWSTARVEPARIAPGGASSEPGPPTTLRYRLLTIHLPLILIGLGLFVAVVLVAIDRWRRGTLVFGIVTVAAAVIRLVLAEDRVGVLAVRSRAFDVATLASFGGLVIWLGASIESLGTG